ncbi:hypothetical protein KP509_29G044900 [Ceratopteris richardii]|uniref:Peptidase S54 rhomboid domain-containing protein n=1 Tax=Ceratopteris richardii TaxID=49495 RepID=A0A8T2R6F2_CERRI|nr:hypothetical protein KP509_29G044900 [Ceratopteris richardii]
MANIFRLWELRPLSSHNGDSRHVQEYRRSAFYSPCFSPHKLQVANLFKSKISKRSAIVLSMQNSKRFTMDSNNSGIISQLEIEESSQPHKPTQSIYWLLLLNLGIFVADHLLKISSIKALYLYHGWPKWYQFFTATFCHLNWKHLSSNLFFLYIFGKLVEEEERGLGLWISYLVTGAGANLVSWLVLPRNVVSVGASGAVFGLFAVSVLVKMSWNWRKILEFFILGQFVLEKVMEAAQASAQMAGQTHLRFTNVNHIAHLSGALVGAALIWMLSQLTPKQQADKEHKLQERSK